MKPCDLRAEHVALFARKIVSINEWMTLIPEERVECENALAAARAMAEAYTGLDLAVCPFEDVTYAVETLAAEMIDNHQITGTGAAVVNPTARQILDMHSTNLLPTVEEVVR